MTLRYKEPSIPAGQTILIREYMKVLRDDITWLADQVTLVPTNAVVHGTGEPGVEGISLGVGKLLTVQYGVVTTIDVPQIGTYELTVGADGIPYWAEV